MRWALRPFLVVLVVAAAYLSGGLDFADRALSDGRFSLVERNATGDVAVVAIDPDSLSAVGVWPWPRSFHAQLLAALDQAGARRIAYDIDFSARSTADQDAALEQALAALPEPAILPTFRQFANPNEPAKIVSALPLPQLARHATLASINIRPDGDGAIRQIEPVQDFGGLLFPFMGARLATENVAALTAFEIDYGIRVDTIPVYSFVDVLFGRLPAGKLRGVDVIVGATAVELGDQLPTPRYRSLPGVVVQALAYESIRQGRMLGGVPSWVILLATLFVAVVAMWAMDRLAWRAGLIALGCIVLGAPAFSVGVQTLFPVSIDVAPWVLAAILAYGLSLVGTIGRQAETIAVRTHEAGVWQRRLFAVFETSFDAIVSVGRGGEIRGLSRSAAEKFGPESLDQPRTLKELMPLPPGALPGDEREALGRRADGSYFTADVSVKEIDGEERIAVVRDTTDRKLLEREAQRYMDVSQDLIAVLDTSGRIQRLNATWQKTLGYPADTLVGNNLAVLLSGADGQRFRDMLESGLEAEATLTFEGRLDTRSGQPKWFSWVVSFSGPEDSIYISGRDISERRRIDAMKDHFVASISQNILMPLTALRGLISALTSEEEAPVDRPRLLRLATTNTEKLIRLVNEVVQMQRLEAGQIELVPKAVNLADVARAVIGQASLLAQEESVTVTLTDRAQGVMVAGDEEQLGQVVSSLLTNAIEASPPGTTVSLIVEADGPTVRLTVRDEGRGIPPEKRHALFEPFGTVGEPEAAKTGLGLGLAKALTERHRGTIGFRTEEGKGTTFFVTLPVHRDNVVTLEPRGGTQRRRQ
jgi:PAS domain S-box-containing protein